MYIERVPNRNSTAATTLGELLSLEDLDEHECYPAMDWLLGRQESIQKQLAKKHPADGGPVLFDLSSSYFEGHTCPLAKHGYSRDKRGDLPQVNYGMYCNADGVPIGVEVLPGNESDRVAFPKAVERVRGDFGRKNVIFVGDRGMIGGKAIDDYPRGEEGARWITALNSASIAKLQRQGDIRLSLMFVDEEKSSAETRDSVVSPANRSDLAKRKDATHRNEHGIRLSSFRDILESLSAVTRSTVLIKGHPKGRFKTTSRPTPYQQEIIRHLGMERHL